METKQGDYIIIVLSNKGYVAVENDQIFQLWKNKCLKDIYEELQYRYPSYKISLGSLMRIKIKDVVEVCNDYLKEDKQPETEHIPEKGNDSQEKTSINLNKDLETGINAMNTRNKAKGKAITVIGINITAGVLHLGFQSIADTICFTEAKMIEKINVFDKTVDEIMNARKIKTKEAQKTLLLSPKRVKRTASQFYSNIKDIKDQAKVDDNTITKTA